MENSVMDETSCNDNLSQSYSQSIERVTRTSNHSFDFQIPERILENRKKKWDNLFNKYAEMSDDIEEEFSKDEYNNGRIYIRKPAALIQYWINTGNIPCKIPLDENELSEEGVSLSEKEITLHFSSTNIVKSYSTCSVDMHIVKSYSTCSSVDTAVYILSNANVTKKADAVAIIEGAKCADTKSSKDVCIKNMEATANDKTECTGTVIDHVVYDDNSNVNPEISDTKSNFISTEYITSKTYSQPITSRELFANTIQPNVSLQNEFCKERDKIDVLNTNQNCIDVKSIDDNASTFKLSNNISRRLTENGKNNDALDQNEMSEQDTCENEWISTNITSHETNSKYLNHALYRKKLHTDRSSPIDLIQMKRHSINKLSMVKQSLHPGLDIDSFIKKKRKKKSIVHKVINKRLFSFAKENPYPKRTNRKRRKLPSFVLSKNIDINNKAVNNSEIQDSITDSSFKISSNADNNSNRQDDISLREYNDTNISVQNKTSKQDLASLNLNPIVLLEQIKPYKQRKSKFIENNHTMQKSNVHYKENLNTSRKVYSCENDITELKEIEDNESTIILCKCKNNTSLDTSFSSDCSHNMRQNIEDDFSASNAGKKDDKLSSLKNIDNQNRETYVVLEKLPLLANKNYINIAMKSQVLNKNDTVSQKDVLNKTETHFCNIHGTNKTDNIKLREIKVVLERLPADKYFKKSNDTASINISVHKKKISQNTSLKNNKENLITTKIPVRENIKSSVQTINENSKNYLRICTESKKNDNEISNTSSTVVENKNQVFDEIESNYTFQYKNRDSQVSRNNYKRSILILTSSDEDDFIQLIQSSRKRLKKSKDSKILGETKTFEKNLYDDAKNKDCYNRNSNMVIHSSKNAILRKIDESIKDKEKPSFVNIKSFDSSMASATSSKKSENVSLFSNKNDNDSTTESLDKRKMRVYFFNCDKNINNNSERCLDTTIKRNDLNFENDVCLKSFQTKSYATSSSDSEESNNYTKSTHKALRSSSMHQRSQYYNHINEEELFNNSIKKKFNKKYSRSSNSSIKKHVTNQRSHNTRTISKSAIDKKAKINKRSFNKDFNDDSELEINNTSENISSSSSINDTRDVSVQKETFLNSSHWKKNLNSSSENKEIFDKSKNLAAIQKNDVKFTKLFQTKNYYSIDSSDSSS